MARDGELWDVVIVGAGAAGMLAALGVRAAAGGQQLRVGIVEKMPRPGRKISASGGGRCNFTNTLEPRRFVERFGRGGRFLGAALQAFPNRAIVELLGRHGVTGQVEQGYRLYTASGHGEDVTQAVTAEVAAAGVELRLNAPVRALDWREEGFDVTVGGEGAASADGGSGGGPGPAVSAGPETQAEGEHLRARSVIIAVGGASYPKLGSTGDGYTWARQFGHHVTALQAALVGVCVAELARCKQLQGLRVEGAAARLLRAGVKKPLASEPGDVLFAHFGLTGPALLDLSLAVVAALAEDASAAGKLELGLDLWPELEAAVLRARLDEELKTLGAADRSRAFEAKWPKRLRKALWQAADPAEAVAGAEPAGAAESTAANLSATAGAVATAGAAAKIPGGDAEAAAKRAAEVLAAVRAGGRAERGEIAEHQALHPASRTPAAVREGFVRAVKDWRFTITGTRELEVGEVTDGGVDLREVDKQTMMSKKRPGLFFCGEILDLTGRCGGFNLQAAWSTGFLAGRSAAAWLSKVT
ncbi:MAG: NAD(P)/FAD-dependent oxidoreductase [Planctomycetota bacterium]